MDLSRDDIRYHQFCLLIRAVNDLASPYDKLSEMEPQFVDLPEEVEEALADPLEVLSRTQNLDVLSREQIEDVNKLLQEVRCVRASACLDSRQAMRSAAEWQNIRDTATAIVKRYVWHELPSRDDFDTGWR